MNKGFAKQNEDQKHSNKQKHYFMNEIFFCIPYGDITQKHTNKQTPDTQLTKRGNKGKEYVIPPNKNNRHKHKGKEQLEAQNYQKTKDKMAIGNLHTSVISLNVNGLNSPIKRHRVADWIKK